MKTINITNACAGSGKTTAAAEYIKSNPSKKFVLVQPNLKLIDETHSKHLPNAKKITSSTENAKVGKIFGQAMTFGMDHVIQITHQTFLNNPKVQNKSKYHLIVDEIINPLSLFDINISSTAEHWLKHVDAVETAQGSGIYKLYVNNIDAVSEYAKNSQGDDTVKVIRSLFQMLESRYYSVYIAKEDWDKRYFKDNKKMLFISVLDPMIFDGWKSVTIMGANFDASFLKLIWEKQGIKFANSPDIQVKDKSHPLNVGSRTTFKYFTFRNWSKHFRDKIGLDEIATALKQHLPQNYIWNANNDVSDDLFDGERLPAYVHGLNDYQQYDTVVSLLSLNFIPQVSAFIKTMYGLDDEQMMKGLTGEVVYQTFMRSNLRDTTGTKPVTIYVPAENIALYFNSLLPGSKVEYLDLGIEALSQPKARTAAEQQKLNRERADALYQGCVDFLSQMKEVEEVKVTFEENIKTTNILSETFSDWNTFFDFMRKCSSSEFSLKTDNLLISGAQFANKEILKRDQKKIGEKIKGLENFLSTKVMQFDFDNTTMSPEFAHKHIFNGYKHLIFNSFNNNPSETQVYRYRVVLPLAVPVNEPIYKGLMKWFDDRISGHGFTGLDATKKTPVAFMYLPCRAGKDEETNNVWFEDRNSFTFDPRKLISKIELNGVSHADYQPVTGSTDPKMVEKIEGMPRTVEEATAKALSAPKGKGSSYFWNFGLDLRRLGLNRDEIINQLRDTARLMRSPSERNSQIDSSIMPNLDKKGYKK